MVKMLKKHLAKDLRTILHRTMTYSMLVYFIYVLYHLPRKEKNPNNFRVLLQEKEYNLALSYQIKKGICFNIYKSTYWDNIV